MQEDEVVTLKVNKKQCQTLDIRTAMGTEKIPLGDIEAVKRGKLTSVFKRKTKLKVRYPDPSQTAARRGGSAHARLPCHLALQSVPASRCFSLSIKDRAEDLCFEVIPEKNAGRGLDKELAEGEGDVDATVEQSDELIDAIAGSKESFLNERKFYCTGFERLISELSGKESFWWDPNGSLRKVSISAFNFQMALERKKGTLDLDETPEEKKKREAEEEKERQRIEAIEVSLDG
jgi:hypothetical protein